MRTLVTGGTGFIGSRLVRMLTGLGEQVRVLCRSTSRRPTTLPGTIEFATGDILDRSAVEEAVKDCAQVYHLAAFAQNWSRNPRTFFEVNVQGLRNVLDASLKHGVERVVFTSTNLTFDPSRGLPVDETSVRTVPFFTDYEQSKFLAEKEVDGYIQKGLPVVIVNPTRVFGPDVLSEANSVTIMIDGYVRGTWRAIPGHGRQVGNYVFVEDVVNGQRLAMQKGRPGEKYILGGENLSFNDFFRTLSEVSGVKRTLMHVPAALALAFARVEAAKGNLFGFHPLITPGWTKLFFEDWACSSTKAEKELGYGHLPIREAIQRTVTWLAATRGKKPQ